MTLSTGTRIGVYEISGALAAGGMGEIYRARDVRLERTVAIKALPREFAKDAERLARFEREARLVASLSHPTSRGSTGSRTLIASPSSCSNTYR
jgi:serine/threonine protein kinase